MSGTGPGPGARAFGTQASNGSSPRSVPLGKVLPMR